MKLRLPNKLIAAIMAAATPVLFSTLSTATLGAAAVGAVAPHQAMADSWSYDSAANTTTLTDAQGQKVYAGRVYTWNGTSTKFHGPNDTDGDNRWKYFSDANGTIATSEAWANNSSSANNPFCFLANRSNSDNTKYISTLRFTAGAANRPAAFTFGPLSIAGVIVESGATGYVVQGSGNRRVILGNTAMESRSDINEDFTLSTTNNNTDDNELTLRGTQTISVAGGKTFTLNPGTSSIVIESSANVILSGAGKTSFTGAVNGTGKAQLTLSSGSTAEFLQNSAIANLVDNGGTVSVANAKTLTISGNAYIHDPLTVSGGGSVVLTGNVRVDAPELAYTYTGTGVREGSGYRIYEASSRRVVDEASLSAVSTDAGIQWYIGNDNVTGATRYENGVLTWNGTTASTGRYYVNSDLTYNTTDMDGAYEFEIAAGKTFTATGKQLGAPTPREAAVVILNEGSALKSASGTNPSSGERQIEALNLQGDAKVILGGDIGIINREHTASSLDLGGHTLNLERLDGISATKNFYLSNTTVEAGTIVVDNGVKLQTLEGKGGAFLSGVRVLVNRGGEAQISTTAELNATDAGRWVVDGGTLQLTTKNITVDEQRIVAANGIDEAGGSAAFSKIFSGAAVTVTNGGKLVLNGNVYTNNSGSNSVMGLDNLEITGFVSLNASTAAGRLWDVASHHLTVGSYLHLTNQQKMTVSKGGSLSVGGELRLGHGANSINGGYKGTLTVTNASFEAQGVRLFGGQNTLSLSGSDVTFNRDEATAADTLLVQEGNANNGSVVNLADNTLHSGTNGWNLTEIANMSVTVSGVTSLDIASGKKIIIGGADVSGSFTHGSGSLGTLELANATMVQGATLEGGKFDISGNTALGSMLTGHNATIALSGTIAMTADADRYVRTTAPADNANGFMTAASAWTIVNGTGNTITYDSATFKHGDDNLTAAVVDGSLVAKGAETTTEIYYIGVDNTAFSSIDGSDNRDASGFAVGAGKTFKATGENINGRSVTLESGATLQAFAISYFDRAQMSSLTLNGNATVDVNSKRIAVQDSDYANATLDLNGNTLTVKNTGQNRTNYHFGLVGNTVTVTEGTIALTEKVRLQVAHNGVNGKTVSAGNTMLTMTTDTELAIAGGNSITLRGIKTMGDNAAKIVRDSGNHDSEALTLNIVSRFGDNNVFRGTMNDAYLDITQTGTGSQTFVVTGNSRQMRNAKANGGVLKLVTDSQASGTMNLGRLDVNGGDVELSGGDYAATQIQPSNLTNGGALKITDGAHLSIDSSGSWDNVRLNEGNDNGIRISGQKAGVRDSQFTARLKDGTQVILTALGKEEASITWQSGTTKNYATDQSGETVANAKMSISVGTNTSVNNKLENTLLINNGSNALTVTNNANTLVGVDAQGGSITVQNAASSASSLESIRAEGGNVTIQGLGSAVVANLDELYIASGKTVSAYQANTAPGTPATDNEGALSVSGTLTSKAGATLNANLTMKNGSTINVAVNEENYMTGGLTMGSSVTFENGGKINLSNDIINGLNSLTIGEGLTLFSGVDAFNINNAAYDADTIYHASDFFNLDNGNVAVTRPWDFVIKFGADEALRQSGSGQSIFLYMETPEPATATLSLLALAALAARRKRK